jgi:Fe-S cluster assembly protein SufB
MSGTNTRAFFKTKKGLHAQLVVELAERKNEPGWMVDFRLKALETFERMPMPRWGADLSGLDIHDIYYYVQPIEGLRASWDQVPDRIKNTFDKLGIPQAEQKFLAGVGAQYESEVVYKRLKKEWQDQGVIFSDMSSAVREHEAIVKRYFSTVIPSSDNKFAALNSAVWSGGSFVYIPAGVHVTMPLQAYFRINSVSMGQFERTLIIAEPGSSVHYVEGCSAPLYRKNALHSAVVELIAHDDASIRYTTIQNWSRNVYNLVTKRAIAHKRASVSWIDGNFGSKVTMKYPCIVLKGEGSKGQVISVAVATDGQHQDAGAKIIHLGAHTTSNILAKSLCRKGGRSSYRGLLKIARGARNARSRVQCEALLFDEISRSDTYPTVQVLEPTADIGHEASVSKISEEQLAYVQSRGLSEQEARAMIINGFIDAFVQELPMEYAVEINRLVALEMEGSIG